MSAKDHYDHADRSPDYTSYGPQHSSKPFVPYEIEGWPNYLSPY
jgi:hypothetical protein